MFKDKDNAHTTPSTSEETIIGPSVIVEGDFGGDGNIKVEGTVKGSIKTKQNLQVAPAAKIHASIDALSASIAGEIKGNIRVNEQVDVLATARITGDIEARTLTVASGAAINGKLAVGEAAALAPDTMLQKQIHTPARPPSKQ